MRQLFRRGVVTIATGIVGAASDVVERHGAGRTARRVGRLAFTNGTVSFHDDEQSGWTPAVINTPLTTGDGIWTEPNARSEISLAGTRVRMEGATQLDMLALDDTQTRLQLAQGRIDVKTLAMDANQPYEIVTPRGTIKLLQQGDYYVEAGSTEDPTRLGVRSGAAQIQALNGQVLAVRAGEVAEVTGDGSEPAASHHPDARRRRRLPIGPSRDRQVVYDAPQYLSAGVTGYEDLNGYGDWINDGGYGRVWVPRAVPSGWAPYRTGHWAYVQPWGWTWIDEQPWGFAPYHYGRWANRNNRWVWVPPQRDVRPVYAPALVAFVGGTELAVALGNQSAAPVGWFPLGPREVYVPSYTTNRDYYQRLNRSARVEDRILEDRWQRAQRREAFAANREQAMMNQRFATVVPTSAFVRSQPVMRSALQVQPQTIAAAPVAPVAAPPAPTASVVSALAAPQPKAATAPAPQQQAAPADPSVPVAKTAIADMPTLARPAATERSAAPGPKLVATQPKAATDDKARQAAPALAPRQGAAPPELKGAITPAPAQPGKPGEPPKPQQAAPQPQAAPPLAAPAPQARPAEPTRQQAAPAPGPQQAKPAEPPKPQAAPPLPQPQQAKPAEPPKPQAAPPASAPQQARPAEPANRPAPPHAAPAPQPPPQQARPEPPKQPPQAAPPPQPAPRSGNRKAARLSRRGSKPPLPRRARRRRHSSRPHRRSRHRSSVRQRRRRNSMQHRRQQPKPPEQAQSRPAPQPDKKDEKK